MIKNLFLRNTKPNRPGSQIVSETSNKNVYKTLADFNPGERVQVTAFNDHLSSNRRAHLIAYGLSPGYWVDILQQSPVTIVQIEYTELALERDLAQDILCQN